MGYGQIVTKTVTLLIIFIVFASYTTYLTIGKLWSPDTLVSVPPLKEPTLDNYLAFTIGNTRFFILEFSMWLSGFAWIVVGLLVWRGKTKHLLLSNGFDHNVFMLMLRLKGGKTRLRIMEILEYPKNRKQIAEELNLDWKAIDKHIRTMLKHNLINEMVQVGNAIYYVRSYKGTKLLKTLRNSGVN